MTIFRISHSAPVLSVVSVLALTAGCSSEGLQPDESSQAASTTQASADLSVNEITIATDAHAKCTLYSDAAGKSMPVWADDAGLVHLWAEQSKSPNTFLLACDESGGRTEHRFDVSDAKTFSPAIPRVVPTDRRELAALSDNPMNLSQAELLEAGYPPRPDPVAAPMPYAKWLEVVSRPMTFVKPHLVERTDVHFGPITTANKPVWGGSVMKGNSPAYYWVAGTMPVPTFSNPPGLTSSQIAPWLGLDGDGTYDVVQDGFFYTNVGGTGTHAAWHEYFPASPVFNTTMIISPGNTMRFWAWAAANSSCNQMGVGYGCFWYKNETTGVTAGTFAVATPPSAATFNGATAEAIYERVSGAPISKFSGTPAINFGAFDINYQMSGQMNDPYSLYTIVNSSSQALVTPFTAGLFGQPETSEVAFVWQQAQ